MKTLVLLRHAKTEQHSGLHDIERKLLPEGKQKATIMAKALQNLVPGLDLIVTSPAIRTRQTASIFQETAFQNTPMHIDDTIYHMVTGNRMYNLIYGLNDSIQTVMLIGHNPVFTFLVQELSGDKNSYLYPASMSVFNFMTDSWNEINSGNVIKHIHLNAKDFEQNL